MQCERCSRPLADLYPGKSARYVSERKFCPDCFKQMWRGRERKDAPSPADVPLGRLPAWKNGEVVAWASIDEVDHEQNGHRWTLIGAGYVARRIWDYSVSPRKQRNLYLHREIMGLVPGDKRQVDHINRDKLDNRRANLRIVSVAQQKQNVPAWGVSRYRGVGWDKTTGRWRAYVSIDGKTLWLGRFDSEEEAAAVAAAKRAEIMTHATD